MANFRELLDRPLDEIKKPKPLPAGTYFGVLKSFEYGESQQKKTPYARFICSISGPGPDIEQEELEGIDLGKKSFPVDFYITPDSEYRLKAFLDSLGIDTKGRTFSETIPATPGKEVVLDIIQQNSPDGEEIYNRVKSVKGHEG